MKILEIKSEKEGCCYRYGGCNSFVALSGVVINDAIILMDFFKARLVETG